jgi:heme oxygenase (biliverdin-IX-beta and delta-forming)
MLLETADANASQSVLTRLRRETAALHHHLEEQLDAVNRLADPQRRAILIRRYAALHIPADGILRDHLLDVADLDIDGRRRSEALAPFAEGVLPRFPAPANRAEALGALYVLEGSTLGGRMILRALAARGVDAPELRFLDPYGADTGARWRAFLAVLDRDVRTDTQMADACRGAVRTFAHAARVLCGAA